MIQHGLGCRRALLRHRAALRPRACRTAHRASLRWKNRDEYVLSSKVGRVLKPAPALRDRVRALGRCGAVQGGLRLQLRRHDAGFRGFACSGWRWSAWTSASSTISTSSPAAPSSRRSSSRRWTDAGRRLEKLRAEGVVKAIGVGVNEWEVCHEALQQRDFDCFLLAGRYTLLEQEALDDFLPLCEERECRRRRRRRLQFGHSRRRAR